ncbi:dipicolinate synthase A chain [Thermoclostridium stercorarium subsp. stercorarium DSM 8532]|uniref:Dipicolinate synthase A chain n=2 Tax=Thermoclostridium stercorarium TaxID=1510 RepID=L7VLK1_THES1|nr:dipicolinate synthase subunit DpsA [Thermoclostridium stercorarium]AGC69065.1 dipicolinate synthase A chain [Thermoclostridium stercorarium subsp. stercorarium DSM 8532]AGI40037.1 2-hydroxyacid dehydrogenase [Thermoclostridium stercorarium subsp. stercorarium DSM 8532]ANW99357.1 dipicolinate synthase A chain [Thermoclostridium stercorarium subsp. thermolacticum DSM 2910]UZQ85026.1 dipicolinate synthase subunit DpsA [Thermoclostridium stercorarium]
MQKTKYLVIGGDMRNFYLAELLKKEYHRVEIYGFDKKDIKNKNSSLAQMINDCDVIICGIPLVSPDGYVNMPFSTETLPLETLIEMIPEGTVFIAGKIEKDVRNTLENRGVNYIDLLDREDMAVLNAIPAAEGAVELIMRSTPRTIHNSRILILGYGRIGKVLARILTGFGAEVWVAARTYSDLSWIEAFGYKPVHLDDLERYITDMNVIVNTIPYQYLTADVLNKVRPDCYLIDLASQPGGIDFKHAEKLGLKTDWALSLPGKVAPLTAAEIIKKTVENVLTEGGRKK